MMNADQITTRLSMMDDKALETFATMHKNDPYLFPLAYSESTRRQHHRAAAQARQAQPQPPVTDAALAQMRSAPAPAPEPDMSQMAAAGIPQLAARNIETLADGGIAGYAEGSKKPIFSADKYLEDPRVQRFLDYINKYEGSPKENQTVGYHQFDDLSKHPNRRVKFNKRGDKSTAAGAYQIINRTWQDQAKKQGLTDFSLENQKRAAIGVLKETGALDALMNNDFEKAKQRAARAWASIPGSTIGESTGQKAKFNPRAEQVLADVVPQKVAQAKKPAAPKREQTVGLSPELARQVTDLLPFSSARAGEVPRAPTEYTRSADGRTISGPVSAPRYEGQRFPQKDTAGLPSLPPRKAEKAAPADDAMYSPEGIPLIAPQGGPDTKAPTTALLTGTADVLLGIPEAVANVIAQDIYNMPYGKQYSWEQAREAAQNNPFVKAAGMLRSGKWFGVENDPAYQKDPLSLIASLPALGAEGVAEKFGLDKDAARLAVENAMVFAPMVGKVKQVQYNMPKLKGKEASTVTPELAQNAVKQALDEVKAAEAKTEAPRLGMSTGETPGVVRTTPEGQGVLPTGEAAARERAGLRGLAEDQLALAAAKRRAAEAEAIAAQSSKVPGTKSLAERFGGAPFATRAAVPYSMLSASTDVSPSFMGGETEPPVSDVYPDFRGSVADEARRGPGATPFPTPVAEEKAPAPTVEQKKAFGLDNEDLLMLGLGMLASPGGQAGNDLSQLFSNFGRAGLGAVASKREREKLAEEKEYRNVMKQYYGKLADNLGNTEQERTIAKVMQEYKVDRLEAIKRIAQAQYDPRMAAMLGVQGLKNEMNPMSMLRDGVEGGSSNPMIESLVNKYAG